MKIIIAGARIIIRRAFQIQLIMSGIQEYFCHNTAPFKRVLQTQPGGRLPKFPR